MKELTTRIVFLDEQTNKRETKFETKDQNLTRCIELAIACDVCKSKFKKLIATKPTYDEADLFTVAKAIFQTSFYHCDCDDKKNAKSNGKASTKTV